MILKLGLNLLHSSHHEAMSRPSLGQTIPLVLVQADKNADVGWLGLGVASAPLQWTRGLQ